MTESEICSVSVGIVLIITVFNLLILALNLKLYTEFFKERVKGKDKKERKGESE